MAMIASLYRPDRRRRRQSVLSLRVDVGRQRPQDRRRRRSRAAQSLTDRRTDGTTSAGRQAIHPDIWSLESDFAPRRHHLQVEERDTALELFERFSSPSFYKYTCMIS